MVASWTFVSRDPEETRAIARELGRAVGSDGAVLALIGPLGSGKTVFVKGLAEGLGVDPRGVSSPTFVIAQQYAVPEDEFTLGGCCSDIGDPCVGWSVGSLYLLIR